MAKPRIRVCVGYKEDVTPIIRQLCANSELEMADKAVKAILQSERRSEFVKDAEPVYLRNGRKKQTTVLFVSRLLAFVMPILYNLS